MKQVITFEQLPDAVSKLVDKVSNIESLLSNYQCKVKSDDADQLLTVNQTAELLSLAVPTIYGLVQRSKIPVCKKGKRLYFSKQELTDWIRTGRKKTISEVEAETDQFFSNHKKEGNNE